MLLIVNNLTTGYGDREVISDLSFNMRQGETTLIIGANGSGKSTLLKAVVGLVRPWKNHDLSVTTSIIFDQEDITNLNTYQYLGKGIMLIPQKDELFEQLTVKENLYISVVHLKNELHANVKFQEVITNLTILRDLQFETTSNLSGGERKMLAIGMAMMNTPKLLLIDEPLAGLDSQGIKVVLKLLDNMKRDGTTIVIVEHRIKQILSVADRVVGLRGGKLANDLPLDLESIKSFLL